MPQTLCCSRVSCINRTLHCVYICNMPPILSRIRATNGLCMPPVYRHSFRCWGGEQAKPSPCLCGICIWVWENIPVFKGILCPYLICCHVFICLLSVSSLECRFQGTRSSAITKSPHWSSAWHVEGPPRTSVETHPRASLESAPALCGVTETLQRPVRESTGPRILRSS